MKLLFSLLLFGIPSLALALAPANVFQSYTEEKKLVAVVETKVFKLYGLNCVNCYRAIERKVSRLPGVHSVRVVDRTKTLIIRGSGYSMDDVHRIVRSEKQRIVK